MSIQLPADEVMVKQLALYGRFEGLHFVSKAYLRDGYLYVYRAVFSQGTLALNLVIDKDNKIIGFRLS